jgi:DNA-binding MarR family transcriptional regulator
MSEYTEKQGQYLAFIYSYTLINGRPPAEADMQRHFQVSPPTVHQMVLTLEERGFISREPGKSRSIQVLLPPDQLPRLQELSPRGHDGGQAQIYQIKVMLEDSKPPIWRRILVPGNVTLGRLHDILQVAMGWTDSHLHQFIIEGAYYGEPHPDYGFEMRSETRARLDQIVPGEGFKFRYEYDFGDSWLHMLVVEKILPPEPEQQYPICVKGKRACPPEDVGGIWGYESFLQAIHEADHPEHADYLDWIGGEFDPEVFDLEEINTVLRGMGRGKR